MVDSALKKAVLFRKNSPCRLTILEGINFRRENNRWFRTANKLIFSAVLAIRCEPAKMRRIVLPGTQQQVRSQVCQHQPAPGVVPAKQCRKPFYSQLICLVQYLLMHHTFVALLQFGAFQTFSPELPGKKIFIGQIKTQFFEEFHLVSKG